MISKRKTSDKNNCTIWLKRNEFELKKVGEKMKTIMIQSDKNVFLIIVLKKDDLHFPPSLFCDENSRENGRFIPRKKFWGGKIKRENLEFY